MDTLFFIVQFIQPIIIGLLVVIISWRYIRKDIQNYVMASAGKENPAEPVKTAESDLPGQFAEVTGEERSTLLQLRLQAHERLIVFVDRLNPSNLFLRLHQPGISARELQALILNEVRAEYQHNVSQQLYLSSSNWEVLSKLKDDTMAMINNAVNTLSPEASGVELSKKVLEHVAAISENPYGLTIALLKQDIHQLF